MGATLARSATLAAAAAAAETNTTKYNCDSEFTLFFPEPDIKVSIKWSRRVGRWMDTADTCAVMPVCLRRGTHARMSLMHEYDE